MRFDPTKVRYLSLGDIPLRPDLARVGTEIRVVGNDSGENRVCSCFPSSAHLLLLPSSAPLLRVDAC